LASVASFWRRYHRTLVAFVKVYLFRRLRFGGRVRPEAAGAAAFVCAGLWLAPGLCGVAWGLLQSGAWLGDGAARRRFAVPRPLGWLATQLFMAVTALLLHLSSLAGAWRLLEGLIGHAGFALPVAARNFFPPDWQGRLVFTDQPLVGHTLGLIVVLLLIAIAAVAALGGPSLDRASRAWRRAYFVVAIYFVLGLVLRLDPVSGAFAGVRL
jgi:hypothetical protein